MALEDVVPVVHIEKSGAITTDHVNAAPCVRVRWSWASPVPTDAGYVIPDLTDTWALIDTGADFSLLSSAFFAGSGPAIQRVRMTGLGGSEETSSHHITLMFPPSSLCITAAAMRTDSISRDSPYQMVLGRHFLATTRFTYNGPAGISSLELLSAAERAIISSTAHL